jgi:HPt (histidine-containing phosphotransfer) domain-containing protein
LYACEAYNEDVFYEARNTSHKLAGSGQTFGFFGISDTARQIELQIERWMKETHIPTAEERERVDHLFHELTDFSKEACGVTTAVLGRGGDNSMRVEVPFANSFTGEKKRICVGKATLPTWRIFKNRSDFSVFPRKW